MKEKQKRESEMTDEEMAQGIRIDVDTLLMDSSNDEVFFFPFFFFL